MTKLDDQIRAALRSGSSAEIGALIAATERAAAMATEKAAAAMERALDPLLVDAKVAAARKEAEDARFTADRMTHAAEQLRQARSRALEAEEQARRLEVYEAARKRRDAAAEALAGRYEALAAELADLLEAAHLADQETARANENLPTGKSPLATVEKHARPAASDAGYGVGPKSLLRTELLAWDPNHAPHWARSREMPGSYVRARPVEDHSADGERIMVHG